MDFKEYTNGERNIRATVVMYEALYRAQGFKPVKNVVRRGGNNSDNVKATKTGTDAHIEQGTDSVLGGEADI